MFSGQSDKEAGRDLGELLEETRQKPASELRGWGERGGADTEAAIPKLSSKRDWWLWTDTGQDSTDVLSSQWRGSG